MVCHGEHPGILSGAKQLYCQRRSTVYRTGWQLLRALSLGRLTGHSSMPSAK